MKTTGTRNVAPIEIKPNDAPPTTGGVQKTAKVARTDTLDGAQSGGHKLGEVLKANGVTPSFVPPAGATLVQPSTLAETSTLLEKLAQHIQDPMAKEIILRGAKAASQVSKMAAVSTPMRLTLKEDKSRPPVIEGYIDRSMTGVSGDARAKVQFTPKDRQMHSFPIDPAAVEGLRNGARISLALEKSGDGTQTYAVQADDQAYAGSFAAMVVLDGGKAYGVGLATSPVFGKVPLPGAEHLAGKTVVIDVENPASPADRTGTIRKVIGNAGGPSSRLLEAAIREGVDVGFSTAAMDEVKALMANPPITGKDLTHLPFITIDNVGSKDLDQAMCIQKRPDGGFDVHYAIADVAHFIPPNSALDREAKRRTQTAYLMDGNSIPMLPKELSEGMISLLPNQKRRAFVVTVSTDKDGNVTKRSFERGVVESKKQMAYTQVQAFMDAGSKGELAGQPWSENLALLKELGAKRVKMAEARGVVPSDGEPTQLGVKDDQITLHQRGRNEVEKWNEQISLLANEAVGAELRASGVKALFRTHPTAPAEKVEAFRDLVGALGVPWPESQTLSAYLGGLDPKDPRSSIISSHCIRVNVPASYQTAYSGGHFGLKLEDYAHFTAPMRRYTDVVVARILAALVEKTPVPYQSASDYTLDQVQKLAEDARRRDSNLEARQKNILAGYHFADKVGQTMEGTVVGVRPSGVLVGLEGSGLQVTLPVSALGGAEAALEKSGTQLAVGDKSFKLGDAISVRVQGVDTIADRVQIALAA